MTASGYTARLEGLAIIKWFVAAIAIMSLSGCATGYVSENLSDVQPSEYQHPQNPQPVQFFFTFKTRGAANERATKLLMADVEKTLQDSGLFSAFSKDPAPSGALLSISLDNVPITSDDEAMAKGFATGFTFGLAGNMVTDGYICTLEYSGSSGATKITKVVHHAIYTTVGAKAAPPNATKASSIVEAAHTVARQAVGNALKELSVDPAFRH